jgi:hypothetical protein
MTYHGLPHPSVAPVRTDADLHRHWIRLMGEGGFAYRTVWTVWFDEDGDSLPIIVPIEDVPEHPGQQLVDNLLWSVKQIIEDSEAATAAMLLSRPGSARKQTDDLVWARALLAAAQRHEVALWPVHLATASGVQPFTPDDLVAAS